MTRKRDLTVCQRCNKKLGRGGVPDCNCWRDDFVRLLIRPTKPPAKGARKPDLEWYERNMQ